MASPSLKIKNLKTSELEDEKSFYNTLDKATHRSCCSCQTLILFFALALLASLVINYLIVKTTVIQSSKIITGAKSPKSKLIIGKSARLAQTSVVITRASLEKEYFKSKIFAPITNKEISITRSGILLSGELILKNTQVVLNMKPNIRDGKIVVDEAKQQQGSKEFYQEFSSPLRLNLENSLNELMSSGGINYATKLNLGWDQITITGR